MTKVQTDTAAVLASMGLTQTQITQIQADQAAVETALSRIPVVLVDVDLDPRLRRPSRRSSRSLNTSSVFPASRVLE